MDCALIDYNETDGITTYMKHSLSASHLLPYDKGKFFSQNIKSKIIHFSHSDRKFLFVDEHHIYELATFTRVCFPIQDLPDEDKDSRMREVVRENRNCYLLSVVNAFKLAGQ